MNDAVLTALIAVIPSVAAIASPIITNWLNNRKEIKQEHMKRVYETKLSLYKEFADSFGALHFFDGFDKSLNRFVSAANAAALVSSKAARKEIKFLVFKIGEVFEKSMELDADIVSQFHACLDLLHEELMCDGEKVNTIKRKNDKNKDSVGQ